MFPERVALGGRPCAHTGPDGNMPITPSHNGGADDRWSRPHLLRSSPDRAQDMGGPQRRPTRAQRRGRARRILRYAPTHGASSSLRRVGVNRVDRYLRSAIRWGRTMSRSRSKNLAAPVRALHCALGARPGQLPIRPADEDPEAAAAFHRALTRAAGRLPGLGAIAAPDCGSRIIFAGCHRVILRWAACVPPAGSLTPGAETRLCGRSAK